jgi:hypothetical protein
MIEVVHDVIFETVIERWCGGLPNVPDSDRIAVGVFWTRPKPTRDKRD